MKTLTFQTVKALLRGFGSKKAVTFCKKCTKNDDENCGKYEKMTWKTVFLLKRFHNGVIVNFIRDGNVSNAKRYIFGG